MRLPIAALVYLFASSLSFAAVQAVGPSAESNDATALHLEPIKQIRAGVDAWPLILNPAGAAEERINATLAQLNKSMVEALHDCDGDYDEWLNVVGSGAAGRQQKASDWSRKVMVTMRGPRFFSVVASDEVFCGGAHPDASRVSLVFDMATGTQADWQALVAKSKGVAIQSESTMDGVMTTFVSPALRAKSVVAAIAQCKDAFQDEPAYLVWPDVKGGVLVAEPVGLPHVVQACAEEIHLSMNEARKLGFDESLLAAIVQAHRQVAGHPKH